MNKYNTGNSLIETKPSRIGTIDGIGKDTKGLQQEISDGGH